MAQLPLRTSHTSLTPKVSEHLRKYAVADLDTHTLVLLRDMERASLGRHVAMVAEASSEGAAILNEVFQEEEALTVANIKAISDELHSRGRREA